MTKAQLLREISSEELTEWMALWMIRAEEREKAERERQLKRGKY